MTLTDVIIGCDTAGWRALYPELRLGGPRAARSTASREIATDPVTIDCEHHCVVAVQFTSQTQSASGMPFENRIQRAVRTDLDWELLVE